MSRGVCVCPLLIHRCVSLMLSALALLQINIVWLPFTLSRNRKIVPNWSSVTTVKGGKRKKKMFFTKQAESEGSHRFLCGCLTKCDQYSAYGWRLETRRELQYLRMTDNQHLQAVGSCLFNKHAKAVSKLQQVPTTLIRQYSFLASVCLILPSPGQSEKVQTTLRMKKRYTWRFLINRLF